MKDLFTEEKILDLFKKEIKTQVEVVLTEDSYDYESGIKESYLTRETRSIIKEVIKENISKLVTKEIENHTKEIVSNMVKDILDNEEIINNGWEKKKLKFEQLVKDELKNKISHLNLERTVKNILDEKVGKLIKTKTQEVIEKTTDDVVKSILV